MPIMFVCEVCEKEGEITIYALSSKGFNLRCPHCDTEFWYTHEENYKAAINLLGIREEQIGEFLNEIAAERRSHLIALGVGGGLALVVGVGIGYIIALAQFGGR